MSEEIRGGEGRRGRGGEMDTLCGPQIKKYLILNLKYLIFVQKIIFELLNIFLKMGCHSGRVSFCA